MRGVRADPRQPKRQMATSWDKPVTTRQAAYARRGNRWRERGQRRASPTPALSSTSSPRSGRLCPPAAFAAPRIGRTGVILAVKWTSRSIPSPPGPRIGGEFGQRDDPSSGTADAEVAQAEGNVGFLGNRARTEATVPAPHGQNSLTTGSWSTVFPSFRDAGGVHRAVWRSCGARCGARSAASSDGLPQAGSFDGGPARAFAT